MSLLRGRAGDFRIMAVQAERDWFLHTTTIF
jgi:hypothetical protein